MLCYFFPETVYFFFSSDVPPLLYYAHIPVILASLFIGLYVLKSGVRSLLNQLFFVIAFFFSLWTTINLITWTNIHSDIIMFFWSFFSIFLSLIAISCIYFIYVFLEKKDISNRIKTIFILLLTPTFIFAATPLNINGFDIANCDAFKFEWLPFKTYYSLLGMLAIIWILFLLINKYRSTNDYNFKKQIILMGLGIELFLSTFFIFIFVASYLTQIGILSDSRLEWYGLLGMVIFMVYISILIVRFKAFHVKLLAAQALVAAIVILIGSQFFFIKNGINMFLTGINFMLAFVFGWWLIRSVKKENERKEQLQLISDKLAAANDQLRKLDNAKSEFISIASHQLRTPLTAVKGFVSLLMEGSYGKVSDEVREILNKIYVSNERLVALVEDMLNLSRIESGRMEYKFEKTDMNALAKEVCDVFLIKAKDKNLKLEIDLPSEKVEAETDRNKVREIVSNLVDNALKYTEKGLVKVRLEDLGESVKVGVTDTGIGVPQEEIPYLFSKFSRGKDTSRLNAGGTGLGLHVGKKMIESLNGKIWVESPGAGKGSTFFVEIPKVNKGEE